MSEPAPDRNEQQNWETTRIVRHPTWRRLRIIAKANYKRALWAALIVICGMAAYLYASAPVNVRYATVKTITTAETLAATGKVTGARVAKAGLDIQGIVGSIYVREGDGVRTGQLILSLDKADLNAKVQSARDSVRSAQAELARDSRPALPSDIRQARAELEQATSVGDAKVAQAQARLKNLQAGPRSQEVKEAEAELARRKQALKKAQKDFDRIKQLVDQGAISQSQLDDVTVQVEGAQTDVTVEEQKLSLLKAGARSGEIDEARAALTEARASRDTSIRSARERLNSLLAVPRREDVEAAQARVNESNSQLKQALDTLSRSDVKAPFDGIVADIPVERGQSVSPGQSLATIYEMSRPVIEVETDEDNLRVLSLGQAAAVSSDAYPSRTFQARVTDLGSQVNPERGTITIRLTPTQRVYWLRPDLTVDVNVITRNQVRRTVVPPDSITRTGGRTVVLLVKNGRTVAIPVTSGATGPAGVAVTGNLKDGDLVARDAANVGPGVDVRLVQEK
jgi:HlyD family secretion protein